MPKTKTSKGGPSKSKLHQTTSNPYTDAPTAPVHFPDALMVVSLEKKRSIYKIVVDSIFLTLMILLGVGLYNFFSSGTFSIFMYGFDSMKNKVLGTTSPPTAKISSTTSAAATEKSFTASLVGLYVFATWAFSLLTTLFYDRFVQIVTDLTLGSRIGKKILMRLGIKKYIYPEDDFQIDLKSASPELLRKVADQIEAGRTYSSDSNDSRFSSVSD